ncbi:MAG: class II fructose-1,6-bisphosphate aldolase [Bacilli bacterium]|nr:class II fructose-1,6-bisphosphate aldolase [Bacilli bacterium]MDD4733276.1 class II fructose-1,6-bisphosphate aldolase [Bacilli bacterium]
MNEMLIKAFKEKYAVPQFNINNLEWTKFILEECQQNNSPVILGVSEGAVKYFGGYKTVTAVVRSLIEELKITVPVALHLDHGSSVESCVKAIASGFTSVMIDASKYPIEENIRITNEVVKIAKKYKISVEAEVGAVGGAEDGVANEIKFATIEECQELVKKTNIDCLAPALGSVHGLYKGEPKLNLARMMEISTILSIPLVLHGGTGIPDETIKESIKCGISKININTELQVVWALAVREFLILYDKEYDPRKIINAGQSAIKKAVLDKIVLFGSYNKG